jgi:N-acetylmuramoyl-L-alanine amidase
MANETLSISSTDHNFVSRNALDKKHRMPASIKRLFFLFLISLNGFSLLAQSGAAPGVQTFTLVIDAGHGGKDPGTKGLFSKEKDVALDIAMRFGKLVEEEIPDVKVIYTRKTDVFIPLHERAAIANQNNADLFVSIHVDGVKKTSVTGTSTFVMGLHKNEENLEVAKRENAVITQEEDFSANYHGFDPNSPESYIRISLQQKSSLDLSLYMAAYIQDHFENKAKRASRGVKQAGFLVLWQSTMPAVLVETGFLTNPEEEKYLNSTDGKNQIARSIYEAFKAYKREVEQKSSYDINIEQRPNNEIKGDTNAVVSKSELIYKLQIASSTQPINLKSKKYKDLPNLQVHQEGPSYKYTVGAESSLESIIKLQKSLKELFGDAFIIAFKDGQRISLQEAKELEQKK